MLTFRDYALGLAPSLYWRVGEAAGTTAADASGNGRTGTYTGTFTLGQLAAIADDADKAVALDGASGRIPSTYSLFVPGSRFSVCIWARTLDLRNDPNCALFGSTAGPNVYLRVNPATGDVRFTPNRTTGNPATTWTAAVTGLRANHLYGLNFDDVADTAELFIDGVSKGSRATPQALNALQFIAGHDGIGSTWPGTIDEVLAWQGTTLSAAQHEQLFRLGQFPGALSLGGSVAEIERPGVLGALPLSGAAIESVSEPLLGSIPLTGFLAEVLSDPVRTPHGHRRPRVRAGGRGKVEP